MAVLYEPGEVSDAEGYLKRTVLSPVSVRAGNLIREWMEDSGLRAWMNRMGHVYGQVEGMNPGFDYHCQVTEVEASN